MLDNDTPTGVNDTAQIEPSATEGSGSPPEQSTATPTESSSADVNAQPLETKEPESVDPFEGLPDVTELQEAVTQKIPMAEGLLRLRTELERVGPQFKELTAKFEPYSPVIERIGSPEEAIGLVDMRDSLYRQTRSEDGYLVPDPSGFVEKITAESPVTADYLANRLIWGPSIDQATGKEVPRVVPLLESIRDTPELRAQALQILGAVDPSQIPQPIWTASQEELDAIAGLGLDEKKTAELQDTYRKLPYEKREELRTVSPEFVQEYLEDQQLKAQVRAEREAATATQAQQAERERHAFREATETAGAQYVDQSIKEGFSGLVEGIAKDWQPTDDPAMNKVAASFVGVVTTALAHGETRFAGTMLLNALKEMGIQVDLSPFDTSLKTYVDQARTYGELSFVSERQRHPGANGNGSDRSITHYKTEAARGLQTLQAQSRAVAGKLMAALDKFFVTRADTHNQTLESAPAARATVNGAPAPSGLGNPYLGKRPDEIYSR